MSQTTMRKLKYYLAWEDEKEEAWLREMARSGWRLTTILFPGIYHFEQTEPADVVYRLDFNSDFKNYPAYLRLFEDAGWEHVLAYGSWHYFRTTVKSGESPEIFSDNASKVTKYRRVLLVLAAILPLFLINIRRLQPDASMAQQILSGVVFFFLLFYIYCMVMLLRRIVQLTRVRE